MEAETIRFRVRLTPRARGDAIVAWEEGSGEPVLRVRVSAPALEGRANRALVRLLAKALTVPSRDVAVVQGATSRDKLIEVRGLSTAEVRRRLAG